ncbi:DUF3147 family protein [Herbidospora sp. NBRC 101105]|uniref:DUF3147 family protein n=1 Tax=Herbidospora sp. NBRC 101105 TaxID=3032195 RepID=UPI0024A00C77|nr:DUF3147 family protein [Herbidospora sp. NBRC 101105]GLX99104.1 hypothetical protein Hesp01_70540 [Herbidospora sp. NBRC 101105]
MIREEGIRLRLPSMSVRGLAVRFAVGAAVFVVAGLIGNRWGPVVGGIFLAVPAVVAAALTLIQTKEQRARPAVPDARGMALGAVGLVGFAGCVWGLAVTLPAWLALVFATLVWAVIADILHLVFGRPAAKAGPLS